MHLLSGTKLQELTVATTDLSKFERIPREFAALCHTGLINGVIVYMKLFQLD
jgi:hypothetical protein